MEREFKDNNGKSKVIIESSDAPLNMPEDVVLANRPRKNIGKMPDIGVRSNGFAGVATLAGIIALGGVLIAYFTLRF